ncbi:hypothetical protein MNBD_GAMMA09-3604 [hydrothermal vent metagenome]|uniref:Thioredoxin domain-containing protein n=1 Tax=hydrothermal vent metagenome TaxID=652676 RepID=A0A3B0XG40_9ZZZZ
MIITPPETAISRKDKLITQVDMTLTTRAFLSGLILLISLLSTAGTRAANTHEDALEFDDFPLSEALSLPDWFSLSFLDLKESLNEAIDDGKKGMIIYFGRKDCAYCKTLLEVNWGDPAIVRYTRQHFNVIAVDVTGARTVTDFDGKTMSEREYSAYRKTNFTPTLVFYNAKGQVTLKLSGYRPVYQFRAALEYAADAHYNREPFRKYLARAEASLSFGSEEINEKDFFSPPPYNLDRTHTRLAKIKSKPLVVFFEHPRCHACDVFHGGTLSHSEILSQFDRLAAVQLNTLQDTPVITPKGKRTTAREWANELNLTFAPALLFFDDNGNEILRVESVIQLYRLKNVLRYIIGEKYREFPTFQSWLHHYRSQLKSSRKP